jgi:putative restriction endonuclease
LNTESKWLATLGKLRVNRSQGLAPHKPLLLLVVLEMIEHGELASPVLTLTPELAFRFSEFGTVVSHRRTQRMDVRLPFFHLSTTSGPTSSTSHGIVSTSSVREKREKLIAASNNMDQTCHGRKEIYLFRSGLYWPIDESFVLARENAFDECR